MHLVFSRNVCLDNQARDRRDRGEVLLHPPWPGKNFFEKMTLGKDWKKWKRCVDMWEEHLGLEEIRWAYQRQEHTWPVCITARGSRRCGCKFQQRVFGKTGEGNIQKEPRKNLRIEMKFDEYWPEVVETVVRVMDGGIQFGFGDIKSRVGWGWHGRVDGNLGYWGGCDGVDTGGFEARDEFIFWLE